jgi:hypothetical protein
MERQYTVARANWLGTKFSVKGADGRELYRVQGNGSRAKFFLPGDDQPRFELRPKSMLSSQVLLVESAVDYTFASMKPLKNGVGWDVIDMTETQVGVLLHAAASLKTTELKGLSTWNALKELGTKYKEMARHLDLMVMEKPVVSFDISKDYKSVSVQVLEIAKGVDERIVVALGLLCLKANPSNGG